MIGNVNTYLTNPGSNNPQKVIDYYSNSDFEYNIRVGDYCKVTLDSNLLYWISGIVVEIDEEAAAGETDEGALEGAVKCMMEK